MNSDTTYLTHKIDDDLFSFLMKYQYYNYTCVT